MASFVLKIKIIVGQSLPLSKNTVLPDVLIGDEVVVYKGLVDFREHVHALCDLSKHSVNAIQIIQILACGDQKLGATRKQTQSHSNPINNTDNTDTVCIR